MENKKDSLTDTVYKILNLVLKEKLKPINYELDEYNNDIGNLQDTNENNKTNLIKTNANMIIDLQNTFMETTSTIENLKDTIKKTNEMHLANVKTMNKIYDLYSKRINTYVNGLIKTMENLQYQINIAYITPTLTVVIDPIHKLYNSIYDTINNNSGFIKKYAKNFDFNKVKPIKIMVDATEPLNANFEKSQEIMDKLGYM
jgi:response regulator RpfG family c-di-GMP phosphodiesterase